jgi:prolipoprotein diacylglyceryltransferase
LRPDLVRWLAQYVGAELADTLAPTWFTCIGLAGVVALVMSVALARRRGIDRGFVATAVLSGYVAAVVAGICVPMAIDAIGDVVANGRLRVHWSGMTSFWGYLAGAAAVVATCRRAGVPAARMADLAAVPLGVALVLARTGCFVAGCDYGTVSSLPWAIRFPAGSPAWRDHVRHGLVSASSPTSLPVHPTELYEAMLGLVIVAVAAVAARRPRRDGVIFLAAATTYADGRLLIETVRGDAERGVHAGVSSGQIFCLLVLAAVGAAVVVGTRRAARLGDAAPS